MFRLITITLLAATPNLSWSFNISSCDFKYFYANTGFQFANDDISVSIACLEPGGCDDIVLASSACGGCFESTCSDSEKRRLVDVAQGSVQDISDFTFSEGDLICSTGQVAVVSRDSFETLDEAHSWPGLEFSGTRFVYMSSRASNARCSVYAFEETTVAVTDQDGVQITSVLSPFSAENFGLFDAEDRILNITSEKPVLASCWSSGDYDFIVLEAVTPKPIYGFSSKIFRGMQVDCDTLESTLSTYSLPACVSSDGLAVTPTFAYQQKFFELQGPLGENNYAGPGLKCTPADGSCIAANTGADGDGYAGTSALSSRGFSSFFVLPESVKQVVLISEGSSATCVESGSSFQMVTSSSSPSAKIFSFAAGRSKVFAKGTTFVCSKPVYFVASYGDDEFNLFGLRPEDEFVYRPPVYTGCHPASGPTPLPFDPQVSPTINSTTMTTPSINITIVAGSTLILTLALVSIIFALFVAHRRKSDEKRKASTGVACLGDEEVEHGNEDEDGPPHAVSTRVIPPFASLHNRVKQEREEEHPAEERKRATSLPKVIASAETELAPGSFEGFTPQKSKPYVKNQQSMVALDSETIVQERNARKMSLTSIGGSSRRGSNFSAKSRKGSVNSVTDARSGKVRKGSTGSIGSIASGGSSARKGSRKGSAVKHGEGELDSNLSLLAAAKLKDFSGFDGDCSEML